MINIRFMMFQSNCNRKKNFANKRLCNSFYKETTAHANPAEALGNPVANEPKEVCTEHLFKHSSKHKWTLRYLERYRSKSYKDMLKEITSLETVDDFWSIYNHIKPPSEIKIGNDYSLFKTGIWPTWDDAANEQGGRWVITLTKRSKTDLDNFWLNVLLCLIEEKFYHFHEICGAIVNSRAKANKISIWTTNSNNEEAVMEIGNKIRDALSLAPKSMQYYLNKDMMVKTGSSKKSIYNL